MKLLENIFNFFKKDKNNKLPPAVSSKPLNIQNTKNNNPFLNSLKNNVVNYGNKVLETPICIETGLGFKEKMKR